MHRKENQMHEYEIGSYFPFSFDSLQRVYATDTVCDSVVPSFITTGFDGVINPLPRVSHEVMLGWNLAIMACALLLVAINKQIFPRQFRQVLSVPKGVSQTNQLLREWTPTRSFMGLSLLVAYVAIIALFVQKSFVVMSRDVVRFNGFGVYSAICGLVAAWLSLRIMMVYVMEWLFHLKDIAERQMTVYISVSTLCFLVMQPIILLLLYNPYSILVWTGVGLLVICALMRFAIGFIETRVSTKLPSFYIFLYLCSLEILPLALLLVGGVRYFTQGSVF